ncbi:hypothetical protein Agub_g220, partial [Astrephomene gubernaculifera]
EYGNAAAAAAAARQRSVGPAALGKALAQAFGRGLGRIAGHDGPKQYLCPLELHVLVDNGLLLPQDAELDAAVPSALSSSSPTPPASSLATPAAAAAASTPHSPTHATQPTIDNAGGGNSAGGGGGGGGSRTESLGSTLYRERWLLSSCHDAEGVPLPAAAAAASAGGAVRPELVAAVAVCIARNEERDLYPASGLFAPVFLLPPPPQQQLTAAAAGPAAAAVAGSALGRMPFLVAGHFYLSRRSGKHVLSPFTRSDGGGIASGGTMAADASGVSGGAMMTSAAAAAALPPLLQHRCDHNRRVLDLASTAWQQLASYFCAPDQYNGPRNRLYDIFPDMAAATAAIGATTATAPASAATTPARSPPTTLTATSGGTTGANSSTAAAAAADEVALYCLRQMYGAASRLPLWRLRTGRFVHLPEGCFLQPTTEGLGPAAMGFMARQLPLFDVPWVVKKHLEAADVHGLRTVSPAVVRPLLKNLGRRQGMGVGATAGVGVGGGGGGGGSGSGGKPTWPNLTVLEATELLLFCSADLLADQLPASAAAGGVAASGSGGAGVGRPGTAAAAGSGAAAGGGSGAAGGLASASSLMDELSSQVRNVVGELVGPALYDQLRQQALGILSGAAVPAGFGAAAAAPQPQQLQSHPSHHAQPASQSPAAGPRYHAARLLDCRGLPLPTAAGNIEVLGSQPLLAAPPLPSLASPASLLPPHCAAEFVHPDCVARMSEHFKDPQYRSSLALRLYTLGDLARHLRTALPPGWDHPMPPPPSHSAAAAAVTPAGDVTPADGPVGLGRAWDSGLGLLGDGPSGLWLWQLWVLVNGMLDAAEEWQ